MIGTVSFPTSHDRTTRVNSLSSMWSTIIGPQNWVLCSKLAFPIGIRQGGVRAYLKNAFHRCGDDRLS